MYFPKRRCENVSDNKSESFPTRSLPDRDQTLLDAAVAINSCSFDKDLGYFVSRCIHGNPCANDVHGLHYQTNA